MSGSTDFTIRRAEKDLGVNDYKFLEFPARYVIVGTNGSGELYVLDLGTSPHPRKESVE